MAQRSHLLRRYSHVLREHHQVLDRELVVLGDFVHASGHLMLIMIRASSVHSLADVAQLRVLFAEFQHVEEIEGEHNVAVDVPVVIALELRGHDLKHGIDVGHSEGVQTRNDDGKQSPRKGSNHGDVELVGFAHDHLAVREHDRFEMKLPLIERHHPKPVHDLEVVVVLA